MNYKVTKVDKESFVKDSSLQKKKYVKQVTPRLIGQEINRFVEDLRRQGYTDEQINQMDIRVTFF